MKELFSFDGRINRKTFWFRGVIILILIGAVYAVFLGLATAIGVALVEVTGESGLVRTPLVAALVIVPFVVLYLVLLILAWAGMATAIKRCQDLDKEGWYCLVVGWNVFVLPFVKGLPHDNSFGPPPR
jgi:uncharacterized membrane protein YhaH (DUF805 family)